jgi:uncharacterized membrane protein SpoIIM required for sporulation
MDERDFVQRRQPNWERLTSILKKASSSGLKRLSREEVRDLGKLYRRAASDLAYARAHASSPGLIQHLNSLVAGSYAILYQSDTQSWKGLLRFFTHEFPHTFRRRLPFFLASVGFLLLGGIAGYLLVIESRDNIDIFVPPGSNFRSSLEVWMSGETSERRPDSERALYASGLMQNNIGVTFNVFALGITGGIGTAWVLLLNGMLLGAFTAMMTHVHQHANFWPGIVPHGVVELTETCIAGAAGLTIGWAILAPGQYRRRDALILAARDAVKLVIGGVFLLIFAGLVEGFISHSLLPKPVKVLFGITTAVALFPYLFLAGREREPVSVEKTERTTDAA